ncbi:MAG: cell wall hydrolase [Pseudomonadota bacterium]
MFGVGPVAKRALGRSQGAKLPLFGLSPQKATGIAAVGALMALSQPATVGHLDAAHLLGLDGPGSERWQSFLTASPAGSIHSATLHLDDERGHALQHGGVANLSEPAALAAIAPASLNEELVTGSIPDNRLPVGRDQNVARDSREHQLVTPAVHAMREARRLPVSLVEQHPFAQLEVAALPDAAFSGHIGMIAPQPEIMVAEDPVGAIEGVAARGDESSEPGSDAASPYALAMIDPSAAGSPLDDTEGQQQISAFLGNDRQFRCLAEGIYFEARGEPRRGQVAVAQVIMNRVHHDEFPDTICGVVYQNQHWRNRCQFSFACDGIPERITEQRAWEESEDVAKQVLEERDLIDSIKESTHYHANYVRPRWAPRMIRLDRIGLHIFYKGRYGGWR